MDDEPDVRRLLRILLEDEGYTVGEAADGVDGLAQLRASPYRLVVLLDYKMPHMNGADILVGFIPGSREQNRSMGELADPTGGIR